MCLPSEIRTGQTHTEWYYWEGRRVMRPSTARVLWRINGLMNESSCPLDIQADFYTPGHLCPTHCRNGGTGCSDIINLDKCTVGPSGTLTITPLAVHYGVSTVTKEDHGQSIPQRGDNPFCSDTGGSMEATHRKYHLHGLLYTMLTCLPVGLSHDTAAMPVFIHAPLAIMSSLLIVQPVGES